MRLNELRKKFLNFFEKNNHKIVASSSLVPIATKASYSQMQAWFNLRIPF